MNKKIAQWKGKSEMWFNEEKNIVVLRNSKHHCEFFQLNKAKSNYWNICVFKKPWTFSFYNGSKYLVEQGFSLIVKGI